jgi:hypothetical protein
VGEGAAPSPAICAAWIGPLLDARLLGGILGNKLMWRLPAPLPRAISSLIFFLAISLPHLACPPFLISSPQSDHPRQKLHSVLSQSVLSPPLRAAEATLRFSPNGKYLLLQDASGVVILRTSPLAVIFLIPAADFYPAQFSADSESVTIISRALTFGTWKLPEGQKIAGGDLLLRDECLDGQLSPDGRFFACITPESRFLLSEVSVQKTVFEDWLNSPAHLPLLNSRSAALASFVNFFSLDVESAFAKPFGIVRSSAPKSSLGHSLSLSSLYFSADHRVLLVNSSRGAFGLDLTARRRFGVSDRFQKIKTGEIVLENADRAVVIENEKDKESKPLILSLKNGKVLGNPQFTADRLHIASNPRYLILYNFESGSPSAGAFDLNETRLLRVPPSASVDVFEDLLAIYNSGGFVALYRLGERQLLSSLRLPLGALPVVSAASVTPSLEHLAISLGGEGAIFQVSNGHRSGTFPKFTAAHFSDSPDAILLLAYAHQDDPKILHVNVSNGETSPAWEIPKDVALHSNGPVLLEYSFKKGISASGWDFEMLEAQVPFRLRARDPLNGKELWTRDFAGNAPIPFADPQDERLVLGWNAKSSEAKAVAARSPGGNLIYKNAKLTDQDSLFEALDARTGNSLGGILVQVGSRAISFDSAFSVGDTMILIKNGVRVSLYSLADGQLKARLVGVDPSVSAESKLLALDLGSGRLAIYDLNSGAKLDQQVFPDDIAYTHFSSDGKRLFVLTEHQAAVILDVSKVREARPEGSLATEGKN